LGKHMLQFELYKIGRFLIKKNDFSYPVHNKKKSVTQNTTHFFNKTSHQYSKHVHVVME
jgi:hypothetical protein